MFRSLLFTGFICLLSNVLVAQWLDYDSAVVRSKGKTKKIKTISRVSGSRSVNHLKKGTWHYFNDEGTVVLSESYRILNGQSIAHGRFEYFDLDGNLIKSDYYENGRVSNSTYVREGLLLRGNKKYVILKDSIGYFSESVYTKDGTFIRGLNLAPGFVPKLNATQDRHLALEKLLGDPVLLEKKPMPSDNLVPNAGFENSKLDRSLMSVTDGQVDDWEVASPSPDYFLSRKLAYEDRASMGFRVYSFTNHIEYLRTQLSEPLEAGVTYCVTLRVRLSEESSLISNLLGVYFHDEPWDLDPYNPLLPKPQVVLKNRWLVYKSQWMTLQCSFTAQGGESYMHIGSFKPFEGLHVYSTTGNKYQCYYLIDNISVSATQPCSCNMQTDNPLPDPQGSAEDSVRTKPEAGKTWILEDVYFDIDRSELLEKSFVTLDALVQFLEKNPTVHIEIGGHTSSTGSLERNTTLSEERANAVRDYVISKGINPSRLKAKGYGPNQPIADNQTERGRSLNRRVQITIL